METMIVPLSEGLKEFVDSEIAAQGYSDRVAFIQAVLWEAQKRKARKAVEALIDEALANGESIEGTDEEWDDMWREIEHRHAQLAE